MIKSQEAQASVYQFNKSRLWSLCLPPRGQTYSGHPKIVEKGMETRTSSFSSDDKELISHHSHPYNK